MSVEIFSLFPSTIYSRIIDFDTKEMEEECIIRSKLSEGRIISNIGGWQSDNISLTEKCIFFKFFEYIKRFVVEYVNILNISNDIYLHNAWININRYKDCNRTHSHPGCVISGVFYIKVPQNSGSIRFHHPAAEVVERDWRNIIVEYTELNSSMWKFTPLEKQLILFPSWLMHEVEQNMSKQDRISISFNIGN